MTWSPEQNSFFDACTNGTDSLMLSAVAGSGKTTTIVEACRRLGTGLSIRFLAFNRDIAEELKKRLPVNVEAATFHSAGYGALIAGARACGAKFPERDQDKSRNALKAHLSPREFGTTAAAVCRLVSLLKSVGAGTHLAPNSVDTALDCVKHFNLEVPDTSTDERVATIATKLLEKVGNDLSVVDFDDMLYLPLKHKLRFTPVNVVFVDEAQDTNAVQRELLRAMIWTPPLGRVVAVGDANQAIYGFRGADANAMGALKDAFNMRELPLSCTFRCSVAVVEEARKWVRRANAA